MAKKTTWETIKESKSNISPIKILADKIDKLEDRAYSAKGPTDIKSTAKKQTPPKK